MTSGDELMFVAANSRLSAFNHDFAAIFGRSRGNAQQSSGSDRSTRKNLQTRPIVR